MCQIFNLHMNWMSVQESDETISYYNIIRHTITLDFVKNLHGRAEDKIKWVAMMANQFLSWSVICSIC